MIVDASAVIAILRAEPEAVVFARVIAEARSRRISAVNFVEAAVVIDGSRDPIASHRLDELISEAEIEIAVVTSDHARIAREAYRDFGKGCGHRAALNLGDCFAYALAKTSREPILFKGDDFNHTDLRSALP